MSECVVRMRMPSKDTVCGMVFDLCGVWSCPVMNRICHQPDSGEIPSWCPIICSLPEGHGDLVEAKEITVNVTIKGKKCSADVYATTIVPAERSEA